MEKIFQENKVYLFYSCTHNYDLVNVLDHKTYGGNPLTVL